jgi:hypothetical protein
MYVNNNPLIIHAFPGNHTSCSSAASGGFPTAHTVAELRRRSQSSPVLLTTAKFTAEVLEAFQRLLFLWHVENFWCGRGGNGVCKVR